MICDLIGDLRHWFESFFQMICDLDLWFDLWFAITDNSPTLQTDGQTTCDDNTALCTKVHRAVKIKCISCMFFCFILLVRRANRSTVMSLLCIGSWKQCNSDNKFLYGEWQIPTPGESKTLNKSIRNLARLIMSGIATRMPNLMKIAPAGPPWNTRNTRYFLTYYVDSIQL